MKHHPILGNKNNFLIYSLAWLTLMSIQTVALIQLFKFPWEYAILDGLVFGVLFFMFGIGLWFFIRFQEFYKKNKLSVIIEHATSLIIVVSIWVFIGIYILSTIFSQNKEIEAFLWEGISWRFVNGFLMFFVLLLFYYLNSYYTHIQAKQKKENDLLRTLKDTEINLLRSKLNPHFLFNSLNSLYALMQLKPENASEMLLELSDYLRFSLNQDYKKLILLKDEMGNLDRYIAIEKMRFGDKIILEKEWNEECDNTKIPALLLQPLFENAIKYGLQGENEFVKIKIQCHTEKEQLHLKIENNYDESIVPRKGAGMGMYSVRKRLEILFKQTHLFKIEKKNAAFIVQLIIPQNMKDE